MRIAVTGAKGQLGQSIKKVSKLFPELKFIYTDKAELDISDPNKIEEFFENNSYDYCINCAAYTAVDRAEEEKEKAFLINSEAVKHLALACLKNRVLFIHVSTDFVFDGKTITPYTETDKPNPINIYGSSKLKGEQYVQEILESYFIIRTSWVYSEFGHNFVKTMLRLGKENTELRVVSDQVGAPTYASDLAHFIVSLIVSRSRYYGIINFSNEGIISWYDFACAIMEEAKLKTSIKPITSNEYKNKAIRPAYSVLNLVKAEDRFKATLINWRESLNNCIKILNG